MRTLFSLVRRARLFLLPFAAFLLVAGIILGLYEQNDIHSAMNGWYSGFWDWSMPWITLAGDGWTITVLALLMFAWDRRIALFTGISCLLASGITQLLKHTLYYGEPRPKWVADHVGAIFRFVPGVENHLYDSFPSGHTTVTFAFCFCLALAVKQEWLRAVLFFVALLIGYSRIYLSQHFLVDIYGGSIIGVVTTLAVFWIAGRYGWVKIEGRSASTAS
jgi:membrane-associated phospholipid phosphatase